MIPFLINQILRRHLAGMFNAIFIEYDGAKLQDKRIIVYNQHFARKV